VVKITVEKTVKARPSRAGGGMEGLDTAPTLHGEVGRCICHLVVGAKVVESPFDAQALQSHRSPGAGRAQGTPWSAPARRRHVSTATTRQAQRRSIPSPFHGSMGERGPSRLFRKKAMLTLKGRNAS
jgi:hypothetical protein